MRIRRFFRELFGILPKEDPVMQSMTDELDSFIRMWKQCRHDQDERSRLYKAEHRLRLREQELELRKKEAKLAREEEEFTRTFPEAAGTEWLRH